MLDDVGPRIISAAIASLVDFDFNDEIFVRTLLDSHKTTYSFWIIRFGLRLTVSAQRVSLLERHIARLPILCSGDAMMLATPPTFNHHCMCRRSLPFGSIAIRKDEVRGVFRAADIVDAKVALKLNWNNRLSSKRVSPLFVQNKEFLHQIICEDCNFNSCLYKRSVPVHRFVLVSYAVNNP